METLADRVTLVQAESARLLQYLHALPADAWSQPSACTQWQIQDVVAHWPGPRSSTLTHSPVGCKETPPPRRVSGCGHRECRRHGRAAGPHGPRHTGATGQPGARHL